MHPAIRGRVYAMGRPRRPGSERVAVRAAASALPGTLSASRKAAEVARKVTEAYLRSEQRQDPFERALHFAQQKLDPDPVEAIAAATDGIVAAKFMTERLSRYEARGCTQLCERAWSDETRAIAKDIEVQLARRFRDYLS